MPTDPIDSNAVTTAPRLAIAPFYKDGKTGALYIHKDLDIAAKPWEEEEHIPPQRGNERFGDVESWVAFVKEHTLDVPPYLTWRASGLRAVLDYHAVDGPGRCQWLAEYPFVRSRQWDAWLSTATGSRQTQSDAIEFLEDHAEDVVEPSAAELMNILRNLRTTVNKSASVELRADGTAAVSWSAAENVSARGGTMDLPSEFVIGIPILKGHVDEDGKPVIYRLTVRLRASVDDKARLGLRFSIPNADASLEDAFADRVTAAKALLGAGAPLLRGAD